MDVMIYLSFPEGMDAYVDELDGNSDGTVHNWESLEFPVGIFPNQ